MAELGQKLGKLSLAILENFVEKALGEKFVDELRQPTDRELAIESALEKSETRFTKEFKNKTFAEKMFTQVKDDYLGLLVDAIEKFYEHPTDSDFQTVLNQIITESFSKVDTQLVASAVDLYINILTEEFALVDEKFRENVRALADLRMTEILRRVEVLLSQRETAKIENTVFRSLHQLPSAPADFTGRETIVAELLNDFNYHKGAAISGLTGMGGIGKTALGLVVAHQIVEKYPDAQIFLDLKGTTTPLGVVDIARYVILQFEPSADLRGLDETNFSGAYQSVLHGRQALLFLDNASDAGQIAPLIPPAPCALLVTSRKVFSVAGIKTHRVGVLKENEAIDFLLDLCPRINDKAAELAKACAYLPLALRIAGSFLKVNTNWKVDKYLEELKSTKGRFETLAKSRAGAELTTEPDVWATFELSYNQLKDAEQKNWRALGVFPASFDGSTVAAVWGMEEEDADNLLAVFMRYYSLVEYNETASRYELHDLLAEYALSQMESGEEQEVRLKHAARYKDVLGAADDLAQQMTCILKVAIKSYWVCVCSIWNGNIFVLGRRGLHKI